VNPAVRNGRTEGAHELIATLRPLPPGARSRGKPDFRLGDTPVDTSTTTGDINNCPPEKYGRKIHLGGNGIAKHHRSGWAFALEQLRELHAPDGIYFDDFVEKKFSRAGRASARHALPYTEPWVGIMHNPPGVPHWFNTNEQAPQSILQDERWPGSLPYCRGLFTLSTYLRDWLASRVPVPVESLMHPTGPPAKFFNPSAYRANRHKGIVQVGWWLRRFHSLYLLPVTQLQKILLRIGEPWVESAMRAELNFVPAGIRNDVRVVDHLTNMEYDRLLSRNLVLLDLYDSSANNALVECIVRGTPVLVNPLDAVVEYLGADYPLYFDNLAEAAAKAEDLTLIVNAHEYLMDNHNRTKLSGQYFLESVAESKIYRSL